MGTVGQQVSVSAAISNAISGNATSGVLYTCPAESYAVVNLYINANTGATGSYSIFVGANIMFKIQVPVSSDFNESIISVFVGPGQQVAFSSTLLISTKSIAISGVQFTNGS